MAALTAAREARGSLQLCRRCKQRLFREKGIKRFWSLLQPVFTIGHAVARARVARNWGQSAQTPRSFNAEILLSKATGAPELSSASSRRVPPARARSPKRRRSNGRHAPRPPLPPSAGTAPRCESRRAQAIAGTASRRGPTSAAARAPSAARFPRGVWGAARAAAVYWGAVGSGRDPARGGKGRALSRHHAAPQGGQPHPGADWERGGGAAEGPLRGGRRPRQGPGERLGAAGRGSAVPGRSGGIRPGCREPSWGRQLEKGGRGNKKSNSLSSVQHSLVRCVQHSCALMLLCLGRWLYFTTCCPRQLSRPGPLSCGVTRRSWALAGKVPFASRVAVKVWALCVKEELCGCSAQRGLIWLSGETSLIFAGDMGCSIF